MIVIIVSTDLVVTIARCALVVIIVGTAAWSTISCTCVGTGLASSSSPSTCGAAIYVWQGRRGHKSRLAGVQQGHQSRWAGPSSKHLPP
jgi:hypothetical protein